MFALACGLIAFAVSGTLWNLGIFHEGDWKPPKFLEDPKDGGPRYRTVEEWAAVGKPWAIEQLKQKQ